ncbi:MAG: hypothetical protein IKS01_00900 [Paludibacteraceae bacterium]|nr:hypothetical protein [Paludibacteraceae bacterium]
MKHLSIVVVSLCLLLSISVLADNNATNCLVVWGQGGIANYIGKTDGAKPSIGGGGGIGIGYEYRGRAFLLQTGLGGQVTSTGLKITDADYDVLGLYDSENWQIKDYQYQERNRRDACTQVALQVPLLVGAHFDYFYFLAGAKLNVYAYNQTKVKATYRTLGYYDEFIDPFEDMNNHKYFTSGDITTTVKNSLSINVAASVELGGEFVLKETRGSGNQYLRVAAFADFNLLNDAQKSAKAPISYPTTLAGINTLQDVRQVDYMHSSMATNPLHQLVAGVKVTFLISSGVKYNCVMCQGGYPSDRDRRRGSRLLLN